MNYEPLLKKVNHHLTGRGHPGKIEHLKILANKTIIVVKGKDQVEVKRGAYGQDV
jgi:hypothetical protein